MNTYKTVRQALIISMIFSRLLILYVLFGGDQYVTAKTAAIAWLVTSGLNWLLCNLAKAVPYVDYYVGRLGKLNIQQLNSYSITLEKSKNVAIICVAIESVIVGILLASYMPVVLAFFCAVAVTVISSININKLEKHNQHLIANAITSIVAGKTWKSKIIN